MKTNTIIFMTVMLLIPLGMTTISSCGKVNDALCAATWATDLQDELNAVVSTSSAYNADPSDANCNAYKNAVQAYINGLKPYGDCGALTGALRTQWQAELNEWEDEVAGLCD
jgi:hypothetical protein